VEGSQDQTCGRSLIKRFSKAKKGGAWRRDGGFEKYPDGEIGDAVCSMGSLKVYHPREKESHGMCRDSRSERRRDHPLEMD